MQNASYANITLFTGLLFSGRITEPLNIEDGMVNVKFNSNCVAVICPIKENAIKTWRLNHITSFGQCGGILTFECCSTCSDPGTSRCSINVIQEKSSTVLNIMEKAIRSNPNTTEIHYERSILGDIYHCDHECGQPQRLLPAYSDPNIYRSATTSPQKEVNVPIDIHEFEVPHSTVSSGHRLSSDSGFPDTPLPQHDVVSINSNTPSPTEANSASAAKPTTSGGGYSSRHSARINILPASAAVHIRSFSETARMPDDDSPFDRRLRTDTDPTTGTRFSAGKLNYSDIRTQHSSPIRRGRIDSDGIQYSTVQHDSPRSSQKLQPVSENEGIYDTPFEPTYWEVTDNGPLSPPVGASSSQRSSRSDSSTGTPYTVRVTSAQSTSNIYTPGSDAKDRSEDLREFPPVPSRSKRGPRPQVKEVVKIFNSTPSQPRGRSRLHSTGDMLDSLPEFRRSPRLNMRGSVDNLNHVGRSNAGACSTSSDLLSKLHEQDELLTKFLARSRNERNDELGDTRQHELYRPPYRNFEHDCVSPTNTRSGRSSASSDRGADRVLTKVASDTVRGYAYKIQIPLSDTVYDVPRRSAPAPNLSNLRTDAPPKPQRYITSTGP